MSSSFVINLSSRLGPCGEGSSRGPDGPPVVGMRRRRYRQECSKIASADVEVAVLPEHRGDVVCQRAAFPNTIESSSRCPKGADPIEVVEGLTSPSLRPGSR